MKTGDAPSPLPTIDLLSLDGAASEVPKNATAFRRRYKPFMVAIEANW